MQCVSIYMYIYIYMRDAAQGHVVDGAARAPDDVSAHGEIIYIVRADVFIHENDALSARVCLCLLFGGLLGLFNSLYIIIYRR